MKFDLFRAFPLFYVLKHIIPPCMLRGYPADLKNARNFPCRAKEVFPTAVPEGEGAIKKSAIISPLMVGSGHPEQGVLDL